MDATPMKPASENTRRTAIDPSNISLRLDDQLCFIIYVASHVIGRIYRPVLDKFDLTYTQYLVLLAMWESGRSTISELSAKLYLDSSTLTPLLKRMEAAGLLSRTRDTDDERRVNVALTDKGELLRKEIVEVPLALAQRLDLPAQAIGSLRNQLNDFVQAAVGAAAPD